MGRKFQGIKPHPMNQNRQYIQNHIESMAERKESNSKGKEGKAAEQGTGKIVNNSGDGSRGKAYRPQPDVGHDVGEYIGYVQ